MKQDGEREWAYNRISELRQENSELKEELKELKVKYKEMVNTLITIDKGIRETEARKNEMSNE